MVGDWKVPGDLRVFLRHGLLVQYIMLGQSKLFSWYSAIISSTNVYVTGSVLNAGDIRVHSCVYRSLNNLYN